MIISLLILLMSIPCLADPNSLSDPNDVIQLQGFTARWLELGVPIGKRFQFEGWVIPPATETNYTWTQLMSDGTLYVLRSESPTYLKVTGTLYRRLDMRDFLALSSHWHSRTITPEPKPVDPNEFPDDPNMAEVLSGITDPNLIPIIMNLMNGIN